MNEATASQNGAKRPGRPGKGGNYPPEHVKWKKGCASPNPTGRRSTRVISDAIKAVLAEVDPKTQRSGAEQLAKLMVQRAKQGSVKYLALILAYAEGRPAQKVSISGGLLHAHAWRPLASLTDAEIDQLDAITKKLTAPVSNALPDDPQNQIESKPAIEAEVLESEGA